MGRKRIDLAEIARQAMLDRGLHPDLPREAAAELDRLAGPATPDDDSIRDLRKLPWISIDNDDSRDLDQLSTAERTGERTSLLVAIADVDSLVPRDSALDRHARANTTSVYTPARIFPMLPEKLSTDLTSLNPGEDRLATVAELVVDDEGVLESANVFRAVVRNHAKLAYEPVADWMEGKGREPEAMVAFPPAAEQVRMQDQVARRLRHLRTEAGALDFETIEAKAEMSDGEVVAVRKRRQTRAHEIIEDLMIATNGVTARFLDRKKMPSLRRVVRAPERWERIVRLAEEHGYKLPPEPDSSALEEFLLVQKRTNPTTFPDISLSIIKLLGRGEYVAQKPGAPPIGHFGLAARDYTHSTAPNRRYPDLVTQRLVKAAIAGERSPYSLDELDAIAAHCTAQEDAAEKVERLAVKAAAALHLAPRVGDSFGGVITGASAKGTWVRIFDPPVEGKIVAGERGLDVGDRVRVRLVGTDPERGFIDFARA
ncbi:MAG TPA: RNB domain-containing ribonuclease [Thermoanaerobaculia bacterium]|nr:RNB domain-containing ribonuclease [Thermoanaerobaculia bacterium]